MKTKKQPLGITLNAIVLVISGILATLGALVTAIVSTQQTTIQTLLVTIPIVVSYLSAIIIVFLAFAIMYFTLAWGLLKHEAWAWWILTILGAVGILADVFGFLVTGTLSLTGIVFSVILFMGLLHHKTIKAVKPDIEWKGWGK